jgi:hypothetical protein
MSTESGFSKYDLYFPQIVTWTILSVRWPEVARWLRRGAVANPGTGSEFAKIADRFQTLAEISKDCDSATMWQANAKAKDLDVDQLRWLRDPSLLLPLQYDINQETHNRLASGIGKGLW